MIDHEAEYVDEVASAVLEKYPDAEITSDYVPMVSTFPHVYIRETNNASDTRSMPLVGREATARLTYTVDVFSNAQSGRKAECKAVMAIVDDVMQSHCFERTMLTPYPNQNDATIYSLVARYTKLEEKIWR